MGWILDLDGVLWRGDQPITGSAAAVAGLRSRGEDLLFCTNNSSEPVASVEAKLAAMGVPATGAVVTSAMAVATLVEPGETVLVCAGPGVVEALDARGAHPVREGRADAVAVGFHRDFSWDRMRIAAQAVWSGARLLATNDDSTYPTADGLVPGGGAILASIERATGVDAVVAGKPNAPMAGLVRARLGPEGIMVGDRPDTDGRFAIALGYQFALVLSGVTRAGDRSEPPPDVVAADLAGLVSDLSA
jgi:4-nitrophenyl phosphatase